MLILKPVHNTTNFKTAYIGYVLRTLFCTHVISCTFEAHLSAIYQSEERASDMGY